jgi:hypothetical protein
VTTRPPYRITVREVLPRTFDVHIERLCAIEEDPTTPNVVSMPTYITALSIRVNKQSLELLGLLFDDANAEVIRHDHAECLRRRQR